MALTYKNARAELGVAYATVYTCPAATTALVLMAQVANVDAAASVDVSAQWLDSSAANAATRVAENIVIPVQSAQNLIGGPVPLEAGDQFQAKASAAGDAELTLAIAEITA